MLIIKQFCVGLGAAIYTTKSYLIPQEVLAELYYDGPSLNQYQYSDELMVNIKGSPMSSLTMTR